MPYERSGGKQCVVVGCNNNQKKLYDWGRSICDIHQEIHDDCPCLVPFKFHCIPRDEKKRLDWLKNINRKDFKPSTKSLVCSRHFVDGRPTKENPNPTLHMGYDVSSPKTPARRTLVRQPLKAKENVSQVEESDDNESDDHLYVATPLFHLNEDSTGSGKVTDQCNTTCCQQNPHECKNSKIPDKTDTSTQTEDFVKLDHSYAYSKTTKSVSSQHTTSEFSIENITTDSEARFYTGLNLSVLMTLITMLSKFGKNLPYKLNTADQILLVLIRLRLGLTFQDVGRRFNVSRQLAGDIFQTWIDIMAKHLSDCIMWLPRDTIRRTLPSSFLNTFPKTTCIVDCSEVFIQRPFSLKARNQTYSSYKSHNTVKFLVGIAPNGYIMYLSHLYGGRASDNFITKSCGILNYFLPGDELMADRGFTIGEELSARRVKLNIPAFLKGKSQLSREETVETRRIASVRIHVERAINRMKLYRILNMTLNIKSLKSLDKIVHVIGALCNLQDSLIKDDTVDTV